jgi:ubiquinone/menaquinone biosynthesis C-methylase UbiE
VSILEIGPGPGLLNGILKQFCHKVATLDFAEDINPDIVGEVTNMPLADSAFDLVCAFQMLEHIPWDRLPVALREMGRVCQRHVLFSVPDTDYIKRPVISFEMSFLGRTFGMRIRRRVFRGVVSNPKEHYWEIGVPPVTSERVRNVIAGAGLVCGSDWVDGSNHYFLCSRL